MDQAASRDQRDPGLTVRLERRALAEDVARCSCNAQPTCRQANKELQYQGLGQSHSSADGTHRRRSSAVRCDIQDRSRPGGEAERGRDGQPDMLDPTRLSVWALTEVPRMPVNDAAALRSATFLLQLLSAGKRVSACRAASVKMATYKAHRTMISFGGRKGMFCSLANLPLACSILARAACSPHFCKRPS